MSMRCQAEKISPPSPSIVDSGTQLSPLKAKNKNFLMSAESSQQTQTDNLRISVKVAKRPQVTALTHAQGRELNSLYSQYITAASASVGSASGSPLKMNNSIEGKSFAKVDSMTSVVDANIGGGNHSSSPFSRIPFSPGTSPPTSSNRTRTGWVSAARVPEAPASTIPSEAQHLAQMQQQHQKMQLLAAHAMRRASVESEKTSSICSMPYFFPV